jgi:hypothetical protein
MRHHSEPPDAGTVICGDALALMPTLPDRSVALALFSPPYAMQRRRQYGGIPEEDYPQWMCRVMAALRPILAVLPFRFMLVQHGIRGSAVGMAGAAVGCFFISHRLGVLGVLVCKMLWPLRVPASEAHQSSLSVLPDLLTSWCCVLA